MTCIVLGPYRVCFQSCSILHQDPIKPVVKHSCIPHIRIACNSKSLVHLLPCKMVPLSWEFCLNMMKTVQKGLGKLQLDIYHPGHPGP